MIAAQTSRQRAKFDDLDDLDEFDEGSSDDSYLKYCFEGAASLSELAGELRAWADDFDRRAAGGWRLDGAVEGGWAHLVSER